MPDYELDEEQCLALISRQRVVRIAFDANDERYLIPLGYAWFEATLCGMTDEGRKTRMASANARVSFQLDNSAETGPFGWLSVTGEADFEVVAEASDGSEAVQLEMKAEMPDGGMVSAYILAVPKGDQAFMMMYRKSVPLTLTIAGTASMTA